MLSQIKLGQNGPAVSRIGLGCMSMSANYEAEHQDDESMKTIQAAYEAGINFFDTADMYGQGHNEVLLSKALKEQIKNNRAKLVLATKCGFVFTADGLAIDVSPEHILKSCQGSLERLGIDYIDLFYLHRMPAGGTEVLKSSLDALIKLLKEGKVKHIGLSEASEEHIRFAHHYLIEQGYPNAFAAVQTEFSLLVQNPLIDGTLNACKELGISFIPYSPLCRGLLTEKMSMEFKFDEGDFRQFLPLFQGNNLKSNLMIRDQLNDFAKTKGCTLTQLALAWLLAQDKCVIPIPGTRYIKNLLDNLGALKVNLTSTDLAEIDKIISSIGVKGTRYTEEMFAIQNIKLVEFEKETFK